jgi:CMP-2-keto-3-deoxyoctulosonic acid synthetase
LRHEHVALLEQLKKLPDGARVRVKITHGLPGSSIDLLEDHQAA